MLKKLTKMLKKDFGKCAAVIVAAGSSSRMQGTDKILASLDGEPLIAHTIRAFQESPVIHEIVVVTREELLSQLSRLCQQRGFDKVTMIVPGGETRVHSVMKGLDQVSKDVDLAAIHDGARPFVTQQIIEQTVRKAWSFHAAAPAVPVKDTIKIADAQGYAASTPKRSLVWTIQTPQVFALPLISNAYQELIDREEELLGKGILVTDDASVVEL